MERRQFLQLGLAATASVLASRPALGRVRRASSLIDEPAMLTIFLRGGNDALNTVIPHADPDYITVRPGLHIPSSASIPLSGANGSVGLNPNLPRLAARFEDTSSGDRRVALMMRTGNLMGLRSHFTEQDLVENGLLNNDSGAPGWLPKLVFEREPYTDPTKVMSLARSINKLYATDGEIPSAHFEATYTQPDETDWRSISASYDGDVRRTRLRDRVLGTLAAGSGGSFDHHLRRTSLDAIEAISTLGTRLPGFQHNPDFDASQIPGGDGYFLSRIEEAIQLMAHAESRYVGLQLGGFDTHNGQSAPHTNRLQNLDRGIDLAYEHLSQYFSKFLILVVSEFGRTVEENGSNGTDHGVGGSVIALGPGVRGGLYNCHQPSWAMAPHLNLGAEWAPLFESTNAFHDAGGGLPQFRDAIVPAVDFRGHFAEIARRHLGLNAAQIGSVMGAEWQAFAETPLQDFLES